MEANQPVRSSFTIRAPAAKAPSTPNVRATPRAVEKAEKPWALLQEGFMERVSCGPSYRSIQGVDEERPKGGSDTLAWRVAESLPPLRPTLRRAGRHDLNGEVQVNARERMVEVHLDLLLGHADHDAVQLLAGLVARITTTSPSAMTESSMPSSSTNWVLGNTAKAPSISGP